MMSQCGAKYFILKYFLRGVGNRANITKKFWRGTIFRWLVKEKVPSTAMFHSSVVSLAYLSENGIPNGVSSNGWQCKEVEAPPQCFILKAVSTLSQECWSFYIGFQYILQKIWVEVIEALIHVYLNSKLFFTEGLSMAQKCSSAFLHSVTLTYLTNFIPSSEGTSLPYSTETL